jgi:UMP-CMP kinase
VDGFPRNEDNLSGWNETVGDAADVKGIIYIKCSEETMTERILQRSLSSGRTDDNAEVIKKRLVQYKAETFPIIERFQKEHRRVFEVDGELGPEAVYASCLEQIKAFL